MACVPPPGTWWQRCSSRFRNFTFSYGRIRIVKAYQDFPKNAPVEMNCYEETRIIIDPQKSGALGEEVYHHSSDSVGITRWKKGYPPVTYLFQRNFNAETCGFLYCKNLSRALKGTPWQYCQLREFYEGVHDQMEVGPYLISYHKIPAIEFFVKLKLFWLVTHVVYRRGGEKDINLNGKNLREVLQIDPADLPCLQKPGADIRELRLIRILRAAGHQPSEEFFSWVNANELTEMNQLALALNNTTPHKLMRYLDQLFSKLKKDTYYNEHHQHEYVRLDQVEENIARVQKIVLTDTERFAYRGYPSYRSFSGYGGEELTLWNMGLGSRKGPKALMELPDTACLVMGNHEIGDARNHYIDSDGNVYLCLPDLSAAVLIAGASAYTDTGEPLSFSHRSAQSIRIMEFEEAIELLHAG